MVVETILRLSCSDNHILENETHLATTAKKKLGKYLVDRQIGKGSAANIYLAEQDSLGRKLVIKELLPLYAANEKIIIRFQREAKLISQLSHDTIIHVYDYWVRKNSYYIAMEYVPGPHLRKILSTVHHVPVQIATIILYQICRGLEHAHQNGVIHRDLKPANIMISNLGQVKILDFGVAHFQTEDNLTALGAVLGTYHYMSPEQALGKKVTPASDVFSLGILFYELLTGMQPFVKDEKGDVLEKIVHKNAKTVLRINPAVPRSLNRVLKKCLKKNMKRRYHDTGEIKKKLEKCLKQYSIDHNAILKEFLDGLSPTPIDPKWPPNFGQRSIYRITHQKLRTYLIGIVIVSGLALGEYKLLSNGMTLEKQWHGFTRLIHSVVERVHPVSKTVELQQR